MTHINTRRDTAANWAAANPVLQLGELGFETNTRKFKFGNGVLAWNDLLYAVSGISATKADVGLGNVNNTADMDKPVSTAQAVAINAKVVDSIADGDTTRAPSRNAVFDALALKAPLASPALTGNPTAPTPAVGDNDSSLATTAFVATALATNRASTPTVMFAVTANDTLSGLAARDGYTPAAGDLALVTAQTTPSANGIYVAASGAWARWTGADTAVEIASLGVVQVQRGTANGGTRWVTDFKATDTLGTTAMTWYQMPGSWVAWVPVFTGLTVGNGTLYARYIRIGKTTIRYRMLLIFGSTTAVTAGVKFTVPFPIGATGTENQYTECLVISNGGTQPYTGRTFIGAGTADAFPYVTTSGAGAVLGNFGAFGMTMGTGARLESSGTYESA